MPQCKEFLLKDIAKLSYGTKLDKNKMTYTNPTINFVSRTANNNGVSDLVDRINNLEPFPKGTMTLAFGGSVGSCFLQEEPYYTGQNVGVIELDKSISKESKLYLISAIEKKCKNSFSTFSREINKHFKTDLTVSLPFHSVVKPDFNQLQQVIGGATDMATIDTSTWKLFKLSDLFEKVEVEKIRGKASDFPIKKSNTYNIPLITAGIDNQGVGRYAKESECPTIIENVITISANGANTGATFYHEDKIAILQDAYAIDLIDGAIPNKEVGLFLANNISKVLYGNFDWSNKAGWHRIKDLEIKLPVTEVEEPDWVYMHQYIKELEHQYIKELEYYLIASELDDYTLTEEDIVLFERYKDFVKNRGGN